MQYSSKLEDAVLTSANKLLGFGEKIKLGQLQKEV